MVERTNFDSNLLVRESSELVEPPTPRRNKPFSIPAEEVQEIRDKLNTLIKGELRVYFESKKKY